MERKKLRFEILIEKLFTNFGKLFLTNLLFAVPSLAFFFAFYFLSNTLFHNSNIVFCLLSIIFIYPFYAGVVKVVRNIVRGDETFSVFQTFISGIKENFLPFLLHGFVISIASIISFLSINLYINLVSQSWIFGALLFFTIIVVLFILFASFYLPLMTVTFELPLRYIYKNSFLMSYGEIKNNFFALFAMIVFFGIVLTFMLIAGNALWALIIVIALWTLLLPSIVTFIVSFFIYDGMFSMVSGQGRLDTQKDKTEKKKIDEKPQIEEADFSTIDISKLKDTDDYIFFNGKMVKQSTLLKMVREKGVNPEEVKKDE